MLDMLQERDLTRRRDLETNSPTEPWSWCTGRLRLVIREDPRGLTGRASRVHSPVSVSINTVQAIRIIFCSEIRNQL